ncbi:hypothetical protein [Ostreiculturibacter nitratireducens]|uniref:hypothetical protein n=1 Tax=Ostreiculturibacter nitratireducens TaxID=3075226 RepID=UPI0031B5FFFD
MTVETTQNYATSPASLPLIGALLRAIGSTEGKIMAAMALLVACVVAAVAVWGMPALGIAALSAVPVIMTTLVLITVGK